MRARPSDRLARPTAVRRKRGRTRRRKSSRPGLLGRVVRGFVLCAVGLVLVTWLPVIALRWIDPMTTAFMMLDDSSREAVLHEWTDWSMMGERLPLAVIASEDQKFADHFGFDVQSIQSSIEAYGDGERLRGASTISQQVAKNLFLWPERSFLRKGLEAYFTLLLELSWSKQRILEVYLNVAEFGTGVYGVGAASAHFFGKQPAQITMREAARLAAVLPNPKRMQVDRKTPYIAEREDWIVSQMARLEREGWLTRIR